MGYIRHHSIIVTTSFNGSIEILYDKAKEIFGDLVSDIVYGRNNGYNSLFIAPDGSKEGWGASDDADKQRKEFIDFIKCKKGDGIYCDWCEVYFDEEDNAGILTNG